MLDLHILWHVIASINIYEERTAYLRKSYSYRPSFNLKSVQQYAQLCKMCSDIRPHDNRNMTYYLTVHWKKSFISAYKTCIYTSFQQASRTIERLCLLIQSTSLLLGHKVTYKIKIMCKINYTHTLPRYLPQHGITFMFLHNSYNCITSIL